MYSVMEAALNEACHVCTASSHMFLLIGCENRTLCRGATTIYQQKQWDNSATFLYLS